MKVKPNISIKPNIYPERYIEDWEDFYKILPGYILYRVNPYYFDVRALRLRDRKPPGSRLPTDKQLEEYRLKLRCCVCGKPCAGLCSTAERDTTSPLDGEISRSSNHIHR